VCGGNVHVGFVETFVPKTHPKTGKRLVKLNGKIYQETPGKRIVGGKYIPQYVEKVVFECDSCNEYEIA